MVVVIGGGITGAATAFYLQQDHAVTIIDAAGPAACSKAAALLSESFGDGTKTEKLHRRAFPLHVELAKQLSLDSFREIPVYQGTDLETWKGTMDEFGTAKPGRHALVDPEELVTKLIEQSGATVEINSVSGMDMDETTGLARGIWMEDGSLHKVDQEEPVVFAMGPWTSRLEDWIDTHPLPIDGVLSTSLVWRDLTPFDSPLALFCQEDIRGCHLEIFQRVDGSLYVSGLGNSKPLKASLFRGPQRPLPGREVPSRSNAALRSLAPIVDGNRPPDKIRACIRPMSPDGIPVVGRIGNTNIYVASGGGQWGITWGPLLGQILANQIRGEEPPLSSALRPKRLDTLVQRTLMQRRSREAWT